MELAYLPDSMTNYGACQLYQSWQEPTDKEKLGLLLPCPYGGSMFCFSPWLTTWNQCKYRPNLKEIKTSEKNCSICLEKKKRFLSNYIKSKQRDCKNSPSIREEEEEKEK